MQQTTESTDLIEGATQSLNINRSALAIGLCLVLSAAAIYQFGWIPGAGAKAATAPSGPPPAAVEVAQAVSMTMAPHTVLPGTVVSVRDAVIASEASGKILSVAYVGAVVKQGESVAEIDSSNAQHLVSQRRAELQRLQSQLDYHTDFYQRVTGSQSDLAVPEIVIAEKRSNMATAKADLDKAVAALTLAENDLQRTSVKAPFDGTVVSQSIQTGEYAQVGSAIVRLVDTKNLEVSARVPASLVQPIAVGTMLDISGMGKDLRAPMRALVPVGDAISRTMELRVELNNTELLVGSAVRVSLPSAQAKEVVAIPRDAVILRTDLQYVFVIGSDNKAAQRTVQLGYAEGDMIEVIGDVEAQDTVVIRGGERLRDGQAVAWKTDLADAAGALSKVN